MIRLLCALLLLVALLGTFVFFIWNRLPYQQLVAERITNTLKLYGLEVSSLEVNNADQAQAHISNIRLGKEPSIHINSLNAHYRLDELWRGKLQQLILSGVEAELYKQQGQWYIGGLEALMKSSFSPSVIPFADKDYLQKIAPDYFLLKDSTLTIQQPLASASIPLEITFLLKNSLPPQQGNTPKLPTSTLLGKSPGIAVTAKPYAVSSGALSFEASLNEAGKEWRGALQAKNIKISGTPTTPPPLSISASVILQSENLRAQGIISSADKAWFTEFNTTLFINDYPKNNIALHNVVVPWAGGRIKINALNWQPGKAIAIPLQLEHVNLASVAAILGDEKWKATGTINGKLPFTYQPNGEIWLQPGEAEAEGPGLISIPDSALPAADNPQLVMVRGALQNFHYSALKIRVSSDADHHSSVQLLVEGNSPDAWEGKRVKLTVNLTGDLLPLIRQSLIPLSDPKALLHKEP